MRPEEVKLLDWETGKPLAIRSGAAALLTQVLNGTAGRRACDLTRMAQLEEHCQQFRAMEGCLVLSLEAQDIREIHPVRLRPPEPSLQRSRDGVVYEFPVYGNKSWAHDGLPPFAARTPIQLLQKDRQDELVSLDLPYQGEEEAVTAEHPPVLLGCTGKGATYRLRIRFPRAVDVGRLPAELHLKAAQVPPAEVTELRHLRRWCSAENRDHPVLNAIVFPPPEVEASPVPQLIDQGIARFPRQVEAVRLGTSNVPLGLIKGPPGTGKTTVITEIVRQFVRRGQRVLVCSQTHQAVRNVLERLHHEGGFRMIRHGRDENLSELEQRYRAGGVEDAYHAAVLTRARASLCSLRQRFVILEQALVVLPEAQAAAEQLALVRRAAAAESQRLEQHHRENVERAGNVLQQQNEESIRVEKADTAAAETRRRGVEKQLSETRTQITRAELNRDATETAHVKRVGRKPAVVAISSSWVTELRDKIIPNWLVGVSTLQERYSQAVYQLNELRPREDGLVKKLEIIRSELQEIRTRRERVERTFQAAYDATVVAAGQQHENMVAQVRAQTATEELRLRIIQAGATSFTATLGRSLSDDSQASAWQALLDSARQEHEDVAAKVGYISRWINDIETEPGGVLACYWDRLQVFFSTCVGLASWRRLVERGREAVDLVIIDEAAHATAPETVVPLLYARRALLIGDEMQLPPVVAHDVGKCDTKECSQLLRVELPQQNEPVSGLAGAVRMSPCWLGCSLFEWLWRARPDIPRVMLDIQFRMHPAIADFIGSVFYPEGLLTGVTGEEREVAFAEFTRPICLIPTSAYADRHEEFFDPGYHNRLEARVVRRVLEKAEAELRQPQEFGIITPYANQVQMILKELGGLLPAFQQVRLTSDDVASVDSFQGSERDVIVISFVRSPAPCKRCQGKGASGMHNCDRCKGKGWEGTGLTFARDLRRLNVAFSRARKMLVLVGDIDALTDGRYRGGVPGGQVLALFRDYVSDHGKVLHLWERGHDLR